MKDIHVVFDSRIRLENIYEQRQRGGRERYNDKERTALARFNESVLLSCRGVYWTLKDLKMVSETVVFAFIASLIFSNWTTSNSINGSLQRNRERNVSFYSCIGCCLCGSRITCFSLLCFQSFVHCVRLIVDRFSSIHNCEIQSGNTSYEC